MECVAQSYAIMKSRFFLDVCPTPGNSVFFRHNLIKIADGKLKIGIQVPILLRVRIYCHHEHFESHIELSLYDVWYMKILIYWKSFPRDFHCSSNLNSDYCIELHGCFITILFETSIYITHNIGRWLEGGWYAHAWILGLLSFFVSSRPLLYR